MSLSELAVRCERATGPDRRLDIEIVVAIDWREPDWEEGERTAREMAEKHGLDWLTSRSTEGFNSVWRYLPRFTGSLDAAMTLVADREASGILHDAWGRLSGSHALHVRFWKPEDGSYAQALACFVSAAALRARAAIVDTRPKDGDAKQAPLASSDGAEGNRP